MYKIKKAFSMAEAIIIITTLAIALAASTPFSTRKLLNIASMGTHGRYEVYMQESIKFPKDPNSPYIREYEPEKIPVLGPKKTITIYKKLNDAEYYLARSNQPPNIFTIDGRKYKSTLYAVISDKAEPVYNPDGSVTRAKVGSKTYQRSTRYIFENNNIKFYDKNKKELRDYKPERRIIEGNLTEFYKTDCEPEEAKNNSCFIIDKESNINGDIEEKPHIKKYIGSSKNPVIDEEIEINDDGTILNKEGQPYPINIPEGVKTITFHAVGGGGAGGGFDSTNKNIYTKDPIKPEQPLSAEHEKILKHHLAKAYRDFAKNIKKA